MRRGQGLSLNVIIIAVIVLIVLVVMVFMFSGRADIFGEQIQACSTVGGECRDSCPSNQGYTEIDATCETQGQVCCKKILDV